PGRCHGGATQNNDAFGVCRSGCSCESGNVLVRYVEHDGYADNVGFEIVESFLELREALVAAEVIEVDDLYLVRAGGRPVDIGGETKNSVRKREKAPEFCWLDRLNLVPKIRGNDKHNFVGGHFWPFWQNIRHRDATRWSGT